MPKNDDVRPTPRSDARAALSKCQEFTNTAQAALADEKWNAAGLNAIHAGIAAVDTALIASAGLRSASQDHGSVVSLLEQQVPEFDASQRRQLSGLLKMKNQVPYERRRLTYIEARQLVDHAARLTRWAEGVVKDHLA